MSFQIPLSLPAQSIEHCRRSSSPPDCLRATSGRAEGSAVYPIDLADDDAVEEEFSLPSTRDDGLEDENFESTGDEALEDELCIDLTGDDALEDELSDLTAYTCPMVLDFNAPGVPIQGRANCRGLQHSGSDKVTGIELAPPGQEASGALGSSGGENRAPVRTEHPTTPASETTVSYEEETQDIMRRLGLQPIQPSVAHGTDSTGNGAEESARANVS